MDEAWKKFFDPQTLDALRGLRLRASRFADGRWSGAHRSPRSGQAVEFSEYRQYTSGEDLRQVDWKVYARTGKFYLRRREDETTLDCHFLIDSSGSMAYASDAAPTDKLTYALRIAASLAFVAAENHDRASLTSIGPSVSLRLPTGGGPGHLMALAAAMDTVTPNSPEQGRGADVGTVADPPAAGPEPPTGATPSVVAEADTALASQLAMAAQHLPSAGLVVILSDLYDDTDELLRTIRGVRQTASGVLVIQVFDPAEAEFPFRDMTQFVGLEDALAITADAQGIAAAYREEFQRHRERLRTGCREAEVTFWSLASTDPPHVVLPHLLNAM